MVLCKFYRKLVPELAINTDGEFTIDNVVYPAPEPAASTINNVTV